MSLIDLRSLVKGAGQAAGVVGAGFQGYGEDKDTAIKEAIQQRVQARDDLLAGIQARIGAKNLAKVEPGEVGYGGYLAGVTNATSGADAAAAAAKARALIAPKAEEVTALAKPTADAKATEITTTAAPAAAAAGLREGAVAAATPEPATGTVLPGLPGQPARVVVTGGRSSAHPIGSSIAVPDVVPKSGGGAGDVMAKRASAALPQIDTALKNFDQYHEPGAAGRLFAKSALGGYAMSDEGQLANQAATAIAQAYAGAKSRSGVPSAATVHDIASQLLIQPGEAENLPLVSAKIARAHALRDELAQLGGSNHAAASGGADPEFDALMSSLTPKKKP